MKDDLIPEKIIYFDGERIIFASEEKYFNGILAVGPDIQTPDKNYIEILSVEVRFKRPIHNT